MPLEGRDMLAPAAPIVIEEECEGVLISPHEIDGFRSGLIVGGLRLRVARFPTLQRARAYLKDHLVGVVVSQAELADGCWKDAVNVVSSLKVPPPSLIVLSEKADERLWAEVLNHGGYDVLVDCSTPEQIQCVCAEAWLAWKRKLMGTIAPRKPAILELQPRTVGMSVLAVPSGT